MLEMTRTESTAISAIVTQSLDRVEVRLDRLDQKADRIPWFILASWVTLMLALIGGLYFK